MTTGADHDQPIRRPLSSGRWWLLTLATWAMIALTFSLGRWQMNRAAEKLERAAAMEARTREPLLDQAALLAQADLGAALHRSVQLQGRWLAERTVYLDNRPMGGRAGFWVITPLQLPDSERVILVQRGWIPRDFVDRQRLAPVQMPEGWVQVRGRLALAPGKLYELAADERGLIRQNLDSASIERKPACPWLMRWWCRRAGPVRACSGNGTRPSWASTSTMGMPSSGSVCPACWWFFTSGFSGSRRAVALRLNESHEPLAPRQCFFAAGSAPGLDRA